MSKIVYSNLFNICYLTEEEINEKSDFFVKALKYGCLPHEGFVLELDRLTIPPSDTENIRDVIVFPKTATSIDLMCESQNDVSKEQIKELGW